MATKPLTVEQCQEVLDILARCGNMTLAASSMWMRLDINAGALGHTTIKHRWRGGVHATRNNAVNAGVNFVTAHLLSM